MINTTHCYIEQDGKWLMLYRNKKKQDMNEGKWMGIGGHFEMGESPEECVIREIKEETGLDAQSPVFCGIVTFVDDGYCEYMHLFKVTSFSGSLKECDEGELRWIDKEKITNLSLWEGDRYFIELIKNNAPFFSMKLIYENHILSSVSVNGERVK